MTRTASDASNARLWLVTIGKIQGEFSFVVFEGGPRIDEGLKSRVASTHNKNNNKRTTVEVTKPDGTILKLPGNVTIVEIVDGAYKESNLQISLEELDAFLNSKPEEFNIDILKKYIATRRDQK